MTVHVRKTITLPMTTAQTTTENGDSIVRIAFAGDVYIPDGVERMTLSDELAGLLGDCQVRSCNFEAPVGGCGKPIVKIGLCLNQAQNAPQLVEQAGFNLVSLANNHIFDYGADALKATIAAFRVPVIGAGKSAAEAFRPYFTTVNGCKLGFLSMGEAEFGAITDEGEGFAWVNHPLAAGAIKRAKAGCDVLLVQVHAGVEQIEIPLPEWRRRYRELVDMGADAVIGGHPHVPQGWETYRGKPILYSTGNFFFATDRPHPLWNKGLLAIVSIGSDLSVGIRCVPICRKGDVVGLDGSKEAASQLQCLCRMLDEPHYTATANRIAVELWNGRYRRYYENGVNGIGRFSIVRLLKFAKRLLTGRTLNVPFMLHNIRIESHLWVVRRALNQLYSKL